MIPTRHEPWRLATEATPLTSEKTTRDEGSDERAAAAEREEEAGIHRDENGERRSTPEAVDHKERLDECDNEDPAIQSLSYGEEREALERAGPRAPVVYAAISARGMEELSRPAISLWGSGISAGIALMTSVIAEGLLVHELPTFPGYHAVTDIGYTLGFIIVIMGRMQLFTEDTVTPVLPLLANPSRYRLARTARLWAVIFAANLVGTFIAALTLTNVPIVRPDQLESILEVATVVLGSSPWEVMCLGVPAGFLIAALVWCMPTARGTELLLIFVITYFIALGDFAHVIAGSGEAFLLLLDGQVGLQFTFLGYILPAFIGNVVGGTALFASLAYVQVMEEISQHKKGNDNPRAAEIPRIRNE